MLAAADGSIVAWGDNTMVQLHLLAPSSGFAAPCTTTFAIRGEPTPPPYPADWNGDSVVNSNR